MIFAGDIHGDITTMTKIVNKFSGKEKLIFTGDFLDSFSYGVEDQIECLRLALKLAKDGLADVIMGNHELSYLNPEYNQCSGYTADTATYTIHLKNDMWKLLKPYIYIKDANILVTHAGLTKYMWDALEFTHDNFINKIDKLIESGTRSNYYDVGRARGGINKFGGPMWCDYNYEFEHIQELNQVFGHTRRDMIRPYVYGEKNTQNYNIDCLQSYEQVLQYNEFEKCFKVITL